VDGVRSARELVGQLGHDRGGERVADHPHVHGRLAVRTQAGDVVMTTADLSRGESETISADLPPGDYVTFCSLPGHESLGIRGTLTVTAP
jgi:uncharacterized cupredoxin-like copper-binding protein